MLSLCVYYDLYVVYELKFQRHEGTMYIDNFQH